MRTIAQALAFMLLGLLLTACAGRCGKEMPTGLQSDGTWGWAKGRKQLTPKQIVVLCKRLYESEEVTRSLREVDFPEVDVLGYVKVKGGKFKLEKEYADKFGNVGIRGYAIMNQMKIGCQSTAQTYQCIQPAPGTTHPLERAAQLVQELAIQRNEIIDIIREIEEAPESEHERIVKEKLEPALDSVDPTLLDEESHPISDNASGLSDAALWDEVAGIRDPRMRSVVLYLIGEMAKARSSNAISLSAMSGELKRQTAETRTNNAVQYRELSDRISAARKIAEDAYSLADAAIVRENSCITYLASEKKRVKKTRDSFEARLREKSVAFNRRSKSDLETAPYIVSFDSTGGFPDCKAAPTKGQEKIVVGIADAIYVSLKDLGAFVEPISVDELPRVTVFGGADPNTIDDPKDCDAPSNPELAALRARKIAEIIRQRLAVLLEKDGGSKAASSIVNDMVVDSISWSAVQSDRDDCGSEESKDDCYSRLRMFQVEISGGAFNFIPSTEACK